MTVMMPVLLTNRVEREKIVKYKCDSIILFLFFSFTENRNMAISRESYSFKIILRSSLYNHLSSNVSMILI
jgi:hypothetical protein